MPQRTAPHQSGDGHLSRATIAEAQMPAPIAIRRHPQCSALFSENALTAQMAATNAATPAGSRSSTGRKRDQGDTRTVCADASVTAELGVAARTVRRHRRLVLRGWSEHQRLERPEGCIDLLDERLSIP